MSAIQFWATSGSSYGGPKDSTIQNSSFDDCGGYTVAIQYSTLSCSNSAQGITIKDNTFDNAYRHHISVTADATGIFTIERNIIKGGSGGAFWGQTGSHGLRLVPGSTQKAFYIRNNIIAGMRNCGIQSIIGTVDNILYVYNNTIVYNGRQDADGNSTNLNVYMTGGASEVKGNIIWGLDDLGATRNYRRELRFLTALNAGNQCDYNLIDSDYTNDNTNDYPIRYVGTNYKIGEAPDWLGVSIGGSSPDGNSIYEKFTTDSNYPDFIDNQTNGSGNYHIQSVSPCIGQGLAALTTYDVDGDTRDGSTPDIGADEYEPSGLALQGIVIQGDN